MLLLCWWNLLVVCQTVQRRVLSRAETVTRPSRPPKSKMSTLKAQIRHAEVEMSYLSLENRHGARWTSLQEASSVVQIPIRVLLEQLDP